MNRKDVCASLAERAEYYLNPPSAYPATTPLFRAMRGQFMENSNFTWQLPRSIEPLPRRIQDLEQKMREAREAGAEFEIALVDFHYSRKAKGTFDYKKTPAEWGFKTSYYYELKERGENAILERYRIR